MNKKEKEFTQEEIKQAKEDSMNELVKYLTQKGVLK